MKFFKSKFFIVTAIAATSVAAVFTAMSLLGYSSYVKSAVNFIAAPAQKLADTVGRAVDGYTSYFSEVDRIKKEKRADRLHA